MAYELPAFAHHSTELFIEQHGKRVMPPMLVVMLVLGTTDPSLPEWST